MKSVNVRPGYFKPKISFVMYSPEETLRLLISKLAKRHSGSYLRFGDGDMFMAAGKNDKFQQVDLRLSKLLTLALKGSADVYDIAAPFHSGKIDTLSEGMGPGLFEFEWPKVRGLLSQFSELRESDDLGEILSPVALHWTAIHRPHLAIAILQIIKVNLVAFIGNVQQEGKLFSTLFGTPALVRTPTRNAFEEYDSILEKSYEILRKGAKSGIVVIAAGVTGRALAVELHTRFPMYYYFDFGSLLDALYGLDTRTWIRTNQTKINDFRTLIDLEL